MILERVAAEGEQQIAPPLGVVGRLEVEDDRDQVLDVLDRAGLAMQVRKSGGLRGSGAGVVVGEDVGGGGVRAEAFAECGRLRLQGVSLRARLGQGVGGGAHSLLGGGGFLEKGRLLLELVGAGSVGFPGGRGLALQTLGGGEGLIAQLGSSGGRGARGR